MDTISVAQRYKLFANHKSAPKLIELAELLLNNNYDKEHIDKLLIIYTDLLELYSTEVIDLYTLLYENRLYDTAGIPKIILY